MKFSRAAIDGFGVSPAHARFLGVAVAAAAAGACSSNETHGGAMNGGGAGTSGASGSVGMGGALTSGGGAGTSSGGGTTRGAGGSSTGTGGAMPANGGASSGGAGGTSGAGGANGGSGGSAGNAGGGSGGGTASTELLYVAGPAANGSLISVYEVKTATWAITKLKSVNAPGQASFLAFNRAGNRLYATDEQQGLLRSFTLDSMGVPITLNSVQTSGHPTHVAVDPDGHFVLGADYNEGKVEVLGTDAMGALTTGVDAESPGSQAHEVVFSPDGKFVFVPCKGSDKIAQFKYTASSGMLDANTPPSVASAGGAGPRHMAFSPDGKHAYVIDENGNTMETMTYDAAKGLLTRVGAVTTLPTGFSGMSTAAEVAVSPDGKFVYGSNRIVGANGDIVVYSVSPDGSLALVDHTDSHGQTPRHFSIDPSGRALFVVNLDSSLVAIFTIDAATGKLTFSTSNEVGLNPYYVAVGPHS